MIYRARVTHPALGWCERLVEAESAAQAAIAILRLALAAAAGGLVPLPDGIFEQALLLSVVAEPEGSSRGETTLAKPSPKPDA